MHLGLIVLEKNSELLWQALNKLKMESWQKQHIHKNLSNLISNTKCTIKFKAVLQGKELISEEENQKLVILSNL